MTFAGVNLREVTDANRDAVCALRVRKHQRRFVASVATSLEDAADERQENPWYRAVYSGDEPVGFVMLSLPDTSGRYYLWRLLIDKHHQGRGIGREVLEQIADVVWAAGGAELFTSYEPGRGGPGAFYRKFGFEPTGEIDDDEIVLRLRLADRRPRPRSAPFR